MILINITKNLKKVLFSIMTILLIQSNLFGQESQNNEIEICGQTISFSSDCKADQKFQGLKSDDFDLMWLYLYQQSGMQGTSIHQDSNGKISYTSSYSLDYIQKKDFQFILRKNMKLLLRQLISLS